MEKSEMPANGSSVRFLRWDEEDWKQGEFDEENQLFIETYSSELVTHNRGDIAKWEYLDVM